MLLQTYIFPLFLTFMFICERTIDCCRLGAETGWNPDNVNGANGLPFYSCPPLKLVHRLKSSLVTTDNAQSRRQGQTQQLRTYPGQTLEDLGWQLITAVPVTRLHPLSSSLEMFRCVDPVSKTTF